MQLHMPDGRPDYEALALHADQQAKQAEALHLAALWRELVTTYRELALRSAVVTPINPR